MASTKTNILYVADLPKDVNSEDIRRLFEDYHFQYVSLNSTKSTMVWAQVFLESEEFCKKARHELNGSIIKGKPIRICNYESKGKGNYSSQSTKESLLVKNIDTRMTQKEFYQIFLKYGDINSAKIEYDDLGVSKGFGYICYYDGQSAEKAKKELNNIQFYGKCFEIVNLIPFKSNTLHSNNTVSVYNFPTEFTEDDLKKLFSKYGEVKFVSIYRSKKGSSSGSGMVTFADFDATNKCILELKENQITFPGLLPLTVKHVKGKEERAKKVAKDTSSYTLMKIQFSMLYSTGEVNNEKDLEKEIRLFIKVVLLEEYNPKEVEVDFKNFCGIVTFNTKEDFENYLKKYEDFIQVRQPTFECFPVIPVPQTNVPNNEFNNPANLQQNPNQNPNLYPGFNRQNLDKNILNKQLQPPNNQPPINNINNLPIDMNVPQGMPIPAPGMPIGFQPQLVPQRFPVPQPNIPGQPMNANEIRPNMNMPQMPFAPGVNPYMNKMNPMQFQVQNQQQMGQMGEMNNQFKRGNPRNMNKKMNGKGFKNKFYNNQRNNSGMPPQGMPNNPQMRMMNPMNQMYPNQMQNVPNMPNMPNMQNPMMNQMQYNQMMKMEQDQMNVKEKQSEEIDHRNLENLDPAQLLSQFNTNQPVQHLFNPETCNIDENEDLANEIADYIYEIAVKQHPKEASKITGMIKEMGIQKMNMLISKKEDLLELIEKGYDMIIKNSEK